jgi:hypothetical protein
MKNFKKIIFFILLFSRISVNAQPISADRMNVLYLGVDNPISVYEEGGKSVKVKVSGCNATTTGSGNSYIIHVEQVGEVTVKLQRGKAPPKTFVLRVKPIPNAVACFTPGGESSLTLKPSELKLLRGVIPDLRNFDFTVQLTMESFEVVKMAVNGTKTIVQNEKRAGFYENTRNLLDSAVAGDVFIFRNIKSKYPFESTPRQLNDIVVFVN